MPSPRATHREGQAHPAPSDQPLALEPKAMTPERAERVEGVPPDPGQLTKGGVAVEQSGVERHYLLGQALHQPPVPGRGQALPCQHLGSGEAAGRGRAVASFAGISSPTPPRTLPPACRRTNARWYAGRAVGAGDVGGEGWEFVEEAALAMQPKRTVTIIRSPALRRRAVEASRVVAPGGGRVLARRTRTRSRRTGRRVVVPGAGRAPGRRRWRRSRIGGSMVLRAAKIQPMPRARAAGSVGSRPGWRSAMCSRMAPGFEKGEVALLVGQDLAGKGVHAARCAGSFICSKESRRDLVGLAHFFEGPADCGNRGRDPGHDRGTGQKAGDSGGHGRAPDGRSVQGRTAG